MSIARTDTILVNGYNLATAFKSFNPSGTMEELDATTLASGFREYEAGFQSAEVSAEGKFASDSVNLDQIHDVLTAAYASREFQVLTGSLQNYADGGDVIMMDACVMKYAVPIAVNSIIMSNANWRSQNGFEVGKWLIGAAVPEGDVTGATNDNSAATSNGALLHAHLENTDASGVDVLFQHSTNGTVWADLGTISLSGDFDSGSLEVTGTINRYTRAVPTATGGDAAKVYGAIARR